MLLQCNEMTAEAKLHPVVTDPTAVESDCLIRVRALLSPVVHPSTAIKSFYFFFPNL